MSALATPLRLNRVEVTTAPVLLSIVIPAYNEGRRIGKAIRRVVDYLAAQPYRSELILVDDGSTDETVDAGVAVWEKLAGQADGVELRVLRNDRNRGKGYSVRQGMLMARGEWILFTDADLSSPIDQLDRLFGDGLGFSRHRSYGVSRIEHLVGRQGVIADKLKGYTTLTRGDSTFADRGQV